MDVTVTLTVMVTLTVLVTVTVIHILITKYGTGWIFDKNHH